ncbi:arginyl-tRNA synthetase [Pochonia chlamydosporia 170]|uniref:arginine--tRNA ligase n=1 Tax=Pochonia chlamydosporia 170 TaxID=1380566 RepID=A0A179EYZ0_METCM|nr:arginyl-tRNA synthetase [Pochonia chlamydosporia 170]OAQ58414.1 arginyl-tRNA synthetase [Pochonia chlamydosporia 170]
MVSTLSLQGLQAFLQSVGVGDPLPPFPLADVCVSPITVYFSYLATTLIHLTDCEADAAWDSIQWSTDLSDLVVVVPRLRLQSIDLNGFACELQKKFPPNSLFEHPFKDEINLRFIFNSHTLCRLLIAYILDRGPEYGKNISLKLQESDEPGRRRGKVIVEFSSPNIGKEFNGGHIRSTIIGMNIASMYESMGWDVVRINYLGDWGQHIGLLMAGWSRFGSEESFEADPLRHLLSVFKQVDVLYQSERRGSSSADGAEISSEKNAHCRRLEEGCPGDLALWKKFRDASIANYISVYERLNLKFDEYSGESAFDQETIIEIESSLKEKGIYEESEGAWIINFKKLDPRGLPNAILRYRNGSTTYLMRDIAAFLGRSKKHSFDKMIYVAQSKQDTHFQQLFAALKLLGHQDIDSRLKHVSFGNTHCSVPTADSSGVLLRDILDYCQAVVQSNLVADNESPLKFSVDDPSVSNTLGIANMITQCLAHRHNTNVAIDVDKIISTGPHTGISLQRWYGALCLKLQGNTVSYTEFDSADTSIFEQEEYAGILRLLIQFPEVTKSSFSSTTLESSTILTYLFRLTGILSTLWKGYEVPTSSTGNVAEMALYEGIRQVLENGMRILGIVPIMVYE